MTRMWYESQSEQEGRDRGYRGVFCDGIGEMKSDEKIWPSQFCEVQSDEANTGLMKSDEENEIWWKNISKLEDEYTGLLL